MLRNTVQNVPGYQMDSALSHALIRSIARIKLIEILLKLDLMLRLAKTIIRPDISADLFRFEFILLDLF